MKTSLLTLFILFSLQSLDASGIPFLTIDDLESIDKSQRWSVIQTGLDELSTEEQKKALLHYVGISIKKNWLAIQAKAEVNLGLIYYRQGAYADALLRYQNALTLFEKLDDGSEQGRVYNLLTTLSKKQKDYNRAHEYLDKTLELCTQIKDSACISTVFDNRGLIYSEQGDFKNAKAYYLITLDIRQRIKDTVGLSYVYNNLAEVASHEKAFELAESYLFKSNEYKVLSKDQFGIAVSYTNLGELYFKQKKYLKAIDYFKQSLERSNSLGIPDLSQWNYRFLSKSYSAIGDTDQALSFLSQSYELKDSLLTVEKLSQITEMETKFDTERKEQKIKVQELEIENQKQRNQNQWLIGLGLLSVLILTFFNYRNRQKQKVQKNKISYQKDLLKTAIQAQEKEKIRISKELHDGLGQQLSGLKMAWQQLGKNIYHQLPEQSNHLNELNKVLGDAAEEVRTISHQMMPKSLQEYGLLPAVEDLLDKTFKNISLQYDLDHFGVDGRFSQDIELNTFRILQELINNIIKHAQASEVSIQLMKSKNNLMLVVEDNGKGLKDHGLNNDGHGLKNMQSRAQLIKGTLSFENTNPGTLATLRVPLN